jgi:uncharacterized protein (DUF433 family)
MMSDLTATDALGIIYDRARWCRENGESDMRNILHTVGVVISMIKEGRSRDEILAEFADEDSDDA